FGSSLPAFRPADNCTTLRGANLQETHLEGTALEGIRGQGASFTGELARYFLHGCITGRSVLSECPPGGGFAGKSSSPGSYVQRRCNAGGYDRWCRVGWCLFRIYYRCFESS